MKNEPDDLEIVGSEEMRSDSEDGNQAQRDRLKASAIKRMETAEHWILICFEGKEKEGYHKSWMGLCSAAGTKMQTLRFFVEMLMDGARMVSAVMSQALNEAQEKRRREGGP